MKNKLSILFFLFANFAFCQIDLMSTTAAQIDSSKWQSIRDRIKDQTIFINVNPTGENYFKRARLKVYLYDFKGAIEDLNEAVKLAPDQFDVYYYRGAFLEKLNFLTEALEDFTVAIKLKPNVKWAWHDRALINIGLKKFADADKDLEKVLELDPNWDIALFAKGRLCDEKQ